MPKNQFCNLQYKNIVVFTITVFVISTFTHISAQEDFYLDFALGNRVVSIIPITELSNTTKFTIEAEIFLKSQENLTNVLSRVYDTNNQIALQVDNGYVYCNISNGSNSYSRTINPVLTTGIWYHIAMVYDGTIANPNNRIKLYVNGKEESNLITSGSLPSVTSSNQIFNLKPYVVGDTYFDGRVDDVRVWNTAINANVINTWKHINLKSNHPNFTNLKLYWNFDSDTSSTVANSGSGTIYNANIENATRSEPISFKHVVGGYLPSYRMTAYAAKNPAMAMENLTHLYYFSISTDVLGNLGSVDSNGNFTPLSNYLATVQSNLNTIKAWIGDKNTKLILVFGGWVSSDYIDEVASNSTARNNVAQNLVDFCLSNNLDGIDIDWENYHGEVNDNDYVNLVGAIKSKILASSNPNLELSVTILPEHDKPNDPIGLAGLFGNIDFLQIMSYGKSRISQGTQIPMSKVQEYYTRWTNAGLPAAKLVLGLPAYAKTLVDDTTLTYNDIVVQNPNLNPSLDNIEFGGKTYYFNGINTIKNKAQYVIDNKLKGVMFWELFQDATINNSLSLLNAVTDIISVNNMPLSSIHPNNNIEFYFNQTRQTISFKYNVMNIKDIRMELYNLNGSLIWHNKNPLINGLNLIEIDVNNLEPSIYVLKIFDGNVVSTKKVLKYN